MDNRIRVYAVTPDARETTNELVVARFAHEGAITRLAWSGDGRTVISGAQDGTLKLWDAAEMKERAQLEKQPDWPSAFAFLAGDSTFVAGRLDGSLACYDVKSGQPVRASAPAKSAAAKPAKPPKITRLEPRGLQRGTGAVKLLGSNLEAVREVRASDARMQIQMKEAKAAEVDLVIQTPGDLPRGSYEITAVGADGQPVGTVSLLVDDLPQTTVAAVQETPLVLPVSIWGELAKPGDAARVEFVAEAGQMLVFDLAAKALGSKLDAVLTLLDATGKVLASDNNFENGGDALLAFSIPAKGRYTIVVNDAQFAGSAEHFFRLSIGELPFVTGCFPLSVPAGTETAVELIGYNLPADRKIKLQAGAEGEIALPLDAQKFRSRRGFKLLVSALPQTAGGRAK